MAKRFTDTDKWKKKFIRSLQAPYKLLWLYILDECDHAGVWIVDFDVAQIRLDENLSESEALIFFSEKIIPIDEGEKWVILDFIEFQYGILNEKNRVHDSVINSLKKYELWDLEEKVIKKNKPLTSPLQGVKDKDKDKDKEKEKDRTISELKIEDCKLPKDDIGFMVIEASLKIYEGFLRKFPDNKDLPRKKVSEWIPPIRELMEKKKYSYDQIETVLIWANDDKFWKRIIIDTESLEKHFEKLKILYHESVA